MTDYINKPVLSKSGLTAGQINAYIAKNADVAEKGALAAGRKSLMRGAGSTFLQVEQETGMNAGLILAIAAHESYWGCSSLAHRSHSLMGYGAFNSNPGNSTNFGGNDLYEGLLKSVKAFKRDFVVNRGQDTLGKIEKDTASKTNYAQTGDSIGTPTPGWRSSIIRIWSGVTGEKSTNDGGGGTEDFNLGSGYVGVGGDLEGFEMNDPNSAMFRGKSPDVEDDDYPDHRYAGNPFVLRIGDSQFFLPPKQISTVKNGNISTKNVIRQKNPVMTKSGYTNQVLTIQMIFPNTDSINGYKIASPISSTAKYYMDGFRSLLAQFYKNPFLPIRNEYINDHLSIFNVALSNISYTTVDGFPDMIAVSLELLECTVEPFTTLPDFMYDRLFCYPVWRWFYQQQLLDKDRYSGGYLKPVPKNMNGKAFFKTLDRDLIEQMKADVISKNSSKTDPTALGEYALSKMRVGELLTLMTDWETGDAVLKNVLVQIKPQITPFVIDDFEQPTYQYLGGIYKSFALEYYCTDRSQVASFENLFSHLEEMARDYRYRFVSGYLAVDNELLNLAGIYYAMLSNMQTTTVEGYDNNYIVRIEGQSYDPSSKNDERIDGFNWASTQNDDFEWSDGIPALENKMKRRNGVVYEDAINRLMNSLELYPDLELPTYESANKVITKINAFRKKRKQSELPYKKLKQPPNAKFVDPDFYFAYPTTKQAYEDLKLGAAGDKIINVLMNGNYDEINNQSEKDMNFKESYNAIMNGIQDNTWDADATGKRKLESSKGITFSNGKVDYRAPSGQAWGNDNPVPEDMKLVEMMTHDMVKYNHRGRMSRAFPTYLFLIVDEGQWVNGYRLFNNYYTYHAITQIDVVKDKSNPVDLAFIQLSNVYGTFDYESRMTDPRKYANPIGLKRRVEALYDNFWFDVNGKVLKERSELMEHVHLKEGARIHLRLGYGSNADDNNIVFNGIIASVNEGEDIQMVCQGDGAELVNSMYGIDPKADTPNEPHNTIQEMLTKRSSNYWFTQSASLEFGDNYLSYYGIEHFGFVESEVKAGFWNGIFSDHWKLFQTVLNDKVPFIAYDVMKNIYRGSGEAVTGQNDDWNPFDKEKNINISSYNRTPWDVGQILSSFVPEFIFAVHPHGFRSTLFFGMPHWPVKYGYVRKSGKEGTKYSDYEELVKPYQQFHVITTGNDIIYNNIQTSSEMIKHVAVGIYQFGDGQKAKQATTVYADRTIMKDRQKTMIVDTGVWQDLFGPDWLIGFTGKYMAKPFAKIPADLMSGLSAAIDLFDGKGQSKISKNLQKWADEYNDTINEYSEAIFTPGEVQARTVAIGSLQKSFMEMYQGELVIFGDAAIKPWDIFYLNDLHNLMTGTAQVGKVTHSLSLQTGFTTVIKPDLLVSRTDNKGARTAIINACIRLGTAVTMLTTRKILTSRFVLKLAQLGMRGTVKTVLGSAKLIPKVVKKARTVRWGKDVFGKGANWVKDAKVGKRALKLLKGNLFVTLLIGGVAEWIETWYEKETKYNNMIYIYPLWKMGEPFAAGITAAAHIIPGYVDPRFYDPFMKNQGVNPNGTDSGDNTKNSNLRHPLRNRTKLNSKYGWRMLNGKKDFHNGVDLAVSGRDSRGNVIDTDVVACADGEIIACGNGKGASNGGMGNYVFLRFNLGGKPYIAVYMHLANKEWATKKGKIKVGTKLGIIGNTGESYGAHLHFELCAGSSRVKGNGQGGGGDNRVDPIPVFKKYGVTL